MAVKGSGAWKKSFEINVAIKYLEQSKAFCRNPSNQSNHMTMEGFLDKQATTIQKCFKGGMRCQGNEKTPNRSILLQRAYAVPWKNP